jgi:glycosyltransferase involved in cell wall biosynthesis
MKKRVAVWTYGGIGVGLFSQGYPMLVKLVKALSAKHLIVVFSFVSVPKNRGLGFEIHSPPVWLKPALLRWIYLMVDFTFRNASHPIDLLLGFWAYPTGFIVTVLGRIFNKPVIINTLGAELANVPEIHYGLLRKRLPLKLIVWTLRKASAVLTISQYQADIIHALGIARSVNVIPWGADASLFLFNKKSWEELKILHVANLTEVKDQETLIKTFAEIRKKRTARLKIVGTDYRNGMIQKLVRELSLEKDVEFVGAVPYDAIPQYYHWANIMVHTSLYEGQCMAVTEAVASGLLVAGTSVGILFDLDDPCRIGVDPKEFKELADRILSLTAQPGACEQKVRNAKHWSDEHDFNWTVKQFDALIRNFIQ